MEKWKDITGYEGLYRISNLGNVYSLRRNLILSQRKGTSGYFQVHLNKKSKAKTYSVHRLVGLHFIENPENLKQINHKDHNKENNFWKNLEWTDQNDNVKHSYTNPNRKKARAWQGKTGKAHNRSKKIYEFDKSGKLLNTYDSGIDYQEKTGHNFSSPSWSVKNKRPIYGKYYSFENHFEMA